MLCPCLRCPPISPKRHTKIPVAVFPVDRGDASFLVAVQLTLFLTLSLSLYSRQSTRGGRRRERNLFADYNVEGGPLLPSLLLSRVASQGKKPIPNHDYRCKATKFYKVSTQSSKGSFWRLAFHQTSQIEPRAFSHSPYSCTLARDGGWLGSIKRGQQIYSL